MHSRSTTSQRDVHLGGEDEVDEGDDHGRGRERAKADDGGGRWRPQAHGNAPDNLHLLPPCRAARRASAITQALAAGPPQRQIAR
jgi:hypothetical protein